MEKIKINDIVFELEKDDNKVFNKEEVEEKLTDYFFEFDYIFGDYAYDKLRLKGFCDENNKNIKDFNDIKGLDKYIKNYCAYGSKYFLLKKLK